MLPDCLTQDVIDDFQRDGLALIPEAFTSMRILPVIRQPPISPPR